MKKTTRSLLLIAIAVVIVMTVPLTAMAASGDEARTQQYCMITFDEAICIAQSQYPCTIPVECEIEHSSKYGWYYEVDLVFANRKEYEVKVNAFTGRIFDFTCEGKISSSKSLCFNVCPETAVRRAMRKYPGYSFKQFQIKWKSGRPYYEVELDFGGKRKKVKVCALSGSYC